MNIAATVSAAAPPPAGAFAPRRPATATAPRTLRGLAVTREHYLVAGMLPVAIGVGEGGEFYRPLAAAVLGGTITSTFLTLVLLPALYEWMERRSSDKVPDADKPIT